MTQEAYIKKQIVNIDEAQALGKELLRLSAGLHRVADDADAYNPNFDTLQYFSFNDAAAELSSMPGVLAKFKQSLIDIKIENDRMLLEGGFRSDIDQSIARIFLSHALCKVKIIDESVLSAVRDALQTIERLKTDLQQ